MDEDLVHVAVSVELPTDTAFALFTEGIDRWWPKAAGFLRAPAAEIGLTAEAGWFERGPDGALRAWGAALAWQPPQRLLLAWQGAPETRTGAPATDLAPEPAPAPAPDPAQASEAELRFTPIEPGRTLVEVTHRGFARHGPAGAELAAALASPRGWPALLEAYRALAQAEAAAPTDAPAGREKSL